MRLEFLTLKKKKKRKKNEKKSGESDSSVSLLVGMSREQVPSG